MKQTVKTKIACCLLMLLSFLGGTTAIAQTDLGVWGGLAINKEVIDDVRLSFKGNLRLDENASSYRLSYAQIGLQYRPKKWMRVSLGTRKVWRDAYSSNGDRVFANTTFVRRWHKRLRTRARIQYQRERDSNSEWALGENSLRYKLSTSWRKKKTDFTWSLGTEWFYDWDARGGDWSKYRLFFGTSYKINKRQSVGLDYLFQSQVNSAVNNKVHILAVEYSISLK